MAVALRRPQLAMQCHISIPGPQGTLALAGASTEQGRQRLWYLASGADMNQDCLTKQHGIQPTASLPCVLEGYELSFAHRGALVTQRSPVQQHRQCSSASDWWSHDQLCRQFRPGGLCSPLKNDGCHAGDKRAVRPS